jgi:hypothetical protein
VPDVKVGSRGVETRLDAQRASRFARLFQTLLELRAHEEIDHPALEPRELFRDRRE